MSFLTPFYLLGLLAIALPIILHLINFRKPQKQAFSTLVFFKQLQRSSMKRLKLKKRLLLALRIALLALLALALARPALSPGAAFNLQSGSVLYMILIENGPGMRQIDERGPLMDTVSDALNTLISRADTEDRFLIYNTHGELLMPQEMGPAQAGQLLEDLEAVNAGNFTASRLDQLLRRAGSTDRDQRNMYVFARGAENISQSLRDFSPQVEYDLELLPVTLVQTGEQPSENVAITSIESSSSIIAAGRPISFEVRLENFGQRPVFNYALSLESEGETAGQYQVNLEPGEEQRYTFELIPPESGSLTGRALLEGDAVGFDNERFFALELPEVRRILLLRPEDEGSGSRSWLRPVFEAARRTADQIQLSEVDWDTLSERLSAAPLPDAVMLEGVEEVPEFAWSGLISFVQQGGGLVLFPGERGTPEQMNRFLQQLNAGRFTGLLGDPGRFESVARVDRLVRGHPVLDNIFEAGEAEEIRLELPEIFHYWRYDTGSGSAAQRILNTNLGDPLLVQHNFGEGRLFVSAVHTSPGWSEFSINPLFAPIFYRLGLFAASGESGGLNSFTLGQSFEWLYSRGNAQAGTELSLNDLRLVPETSNTSRGLRIQATTAEWRPGIARLSINEDTLSIAVNQQMEESKLHAVDYERYLEIFESFVDIDNVITLENEPDRLNLARQLGVARSGSEFWHWLVALGILMLLSESFVTKKLEGDHS